MRTPVPSLQFIGEMGVYLPSRDAVKITALDGDRVVDCYAMRSALEAVGGAPGVQETEITRAFERCRDTIEIAAMVKYRRALARTAELKVEAADVVVVLAASVA
jgi:Protein of unknown function (DUF1488)